MIFWKDIDFQTIALQDKRRNENDRYDFSDGIT